MCNSSDKLSWEPLCFQDLSSSGFSPLTQQSMATQVDEVESEPEPEHIDVVPAPSISEEELELLKQEAKSQAYQEGFEQGHKEGFENGKQSGYDQGYLVGQQQGREQIEQQLDDEKKQAVQAITHLINNFEQSIKEIDELIVPQLFDLALVAAQKTVGSLSKVKQKQLMHTINQLVEQCSMLSDPIVLHLNPADLRWLEPMLNDDINPHQWQFIADANVEEGGCKLLTDTNEVNSNINQHWQMMSDHLQGENH
ncbi:FliH/SctL family protein [Gilliamella sp. CG25]|uniref:FliH/SctL family protein n=1 Tax=unclassified Gilliamella TaxID=2685620 RepID=UPI003985892D